MPAIDKSHYAQANGLAIEGMAIVHAAPGDDRSLRMAWRAADRVRENRSRAALTVPGWYKRVDWYRRVEWWDRAEGSLPHADVAYPELGRPANRRCSPPHFEASELCALGAQRRSPG